MSTNAITPFRWDAFDVYLFDIDGTLLNSRDGVQYNAFHAALQQVWGVNHKIDHVPVHGSTDIAILRATAALGGVVDGKFEQRLPEALAIMCSEAERNRS
jgi:beta-phosphoglucomutase-like phosphatase (HAD superfamily)